MAAEIENQTLAVSTPKISKYGRLGGYLAPSYGTPISSVRALILSYPGQGKTFLYQGCSDAFIFNLDESRTVNPKPRATVWPVMSPSGETIGDEGKVVVLTWEHIVAKIEILKTMAKANEPRPRTVVIDSVSAMIRLLINYVLRKSGKASWKDIHGQTAWGEVYDIVAATMSTLSAHGYGVHYLGHLKQVQIPIADGETLIRPEMTISDALYGRLHDMLDFVGMLSSQTELVDQEVETTLNIRGAIRVDKKTVKVPVRTRFITTRDKDLQDVLKERTFNPLPDIIRLDSQDPWGSLSRAYEEADAPKPLA